MSNAAREKADIGWRSSDQMDDGRKSINIDKIKEAYLKIPLFGNIFMGINYYRY